MEPLKEMFNKKFYEQLAQEILKVDKSFNPKLFLKDVLFDLENLSLNQRLRNTSVVLNKQYSSNFKSTIEIFSNVIPQIKGGYTTLIFPDFVGLFGQNDFDASMHALKYFTQFGSSEFAIREFLKRDFSKTIKVMNKWAEDKNHHVRRLASEGSRSRLPWSFKLEEIIKNPKSTSYILEKLKADEELYVRKSVANHLNDLSKDNPDYMLSMVKSWDTSNKHTAWIIKHASRTLIKKGDATSLAIFDFEKNIKLKVENFNLNKSKLKLGEQLKFKFDLISEKNKSQKLVVDFIIHYKKSNNTLSPKVFKLKEIELKSHETIHISKKMWFKNFSTRKHYYGLHKIEIIINGKSQIIKNFELVK